MCINHHLTKDYRPYELGSKLWVMSGWNLNSKKTENWFNLDCWQRPLSKIENNEPEDKTKKIEVTSYLSMNKQNAYKG